MMKVKEGKVFVKACPNCGSINSALANLVPSFGGNFLRCKDCEYEGPFVELAEKDINKFKKALQRNKK
jgi:predicted RNA-binding Zn-ribbon protein involved in translation (DUF1610 family)